MPGLEVHLPDYSVTCWRVPERVSGPSLPLICVPSIFLLILTRFPESADEKYSHSMILPPPCFIAGMLFSGWWEVEGCPSHTVVFDGLKVWVLTLPGLGLSFLPALWVLGVDYWQVYWGSAIFHFLRMDFMKLCGCRVLGCILEPKHDLYFWFILHHNMIFLKFYNKLLIFKMLLL